MAPECAWLASTPVVLMHAEKQLACIVETGMYIVPDEVATSLPIPWCYLTDFVSLPIISWNNLLSCVEAKNGESPIFIRSPEVPIILMETQ